MLSSIALRLREGVETQPMFDRRSIPVYVMLGTTVAAAFVVLTADGYSIDRRYLMLGWTFPILFLAAFAARRVDHPRLAGALEANTLLTGQAVFIYLLLIPLAASGGPYVDPILSRLDTMMGFQWPAYAHSSAPYMRILFPAYLSFHVQPTLVIVLLFWSRLEDRAWRLVTAATIALVITAIVFPFVPAKGAFVYYGVTDYPGFPASAEWQVYEVLQHIRSGARFIDHRALGGIVSFPSFHTVMATLLVWAAWPTWARIPTVLLNILMVLAAIVCGSHYLIDIVGGVMLAVLSLWLAKLIFELNTTVAERTESRA